MFDIFCFFGRHSWGYFYGIRGSYRKCSSCGKAQKSISSSDIKLPMYYDVGPEVLTNDSATEIKIVR